MKKTQLLLIVLAWVVACAPAARGSDLARQALEDFFSALNRADYAVADALYGGSYETLTGNNPDVDPDDHSTLWERGCTQNGLQCLTVRSATLKEQGDEGFVFTVEFNNPDGSLFVLGPCCGASETEMPPVSQFEFRVEKSAEGDYLVMDLPVYVP